MPCDMLHLSILFQLSGGQGYLKYSLFAAGGGGDPEGAKTGMSATNQV